MWPAPEISRAPRPVLLWWVALLPVLAAYANVGGVGFMWDDHLLIEQNPALQVLHAPWAYLGHGFWDRAFATSTSAYYRPLVTFTFALDWALGDGGPLPFHLTNLALHLAVCTLVFGLAWRRAGSAVTAAVITALFGVLPRLTESVTWVVGRTDVLATLFVLAALRVTEAKRPWVRATAGGLVLLGLLSKEVALVGALLLLADAGGRVLRGRSPARAELPLLITTGLGVATWLLLRPASAPTRLHEPLTFLAGVGHCVVMLLTPWQPAAQIGFVGAPEAWAAGLGAVALGAVGLLAWRWGRSDAPWRATWLLAATGGVVLVSAVVLATFTLASDRFLYLPLALGAVVAAQRPWGRPALLVGAGLTLALGLVTWQRNETWASPVRFWRETLEAASPRNPGPLLGLGDVLFERARYEEARDLYLRAAELRGPSREPESELGLAVTESKLGHDAEALALLERVLAAHPASQRAAYDRVLFRARALDFGGARGALQEARARFGDDAVLLGFEQLLATTEAALRSGAPLERARALGALGATRKAQPLFEALLPEPEAARWLVWSGDAAAARRGLEVLGDDVAAQATWAERFPEPR